MARKMDDFYRSFIRQAVRHENYWTYGSHTTIPDTFVSTAMADVSNLINILEAITGEDYRRMEPVKDALQAES